MGHQYKYDKQAFLKMDLLGTNFSTDHIQGSNEVNAGIDIEAEYAQGEDDGDGLIPGDYDSGAPNGQRMTPMRFFSTMGADVEMESSRKRAKSIDYSR